MNNISDDSINEIRDAGFLLDSVPNDEDDSILTEYEFSSQNSNYSIETLIDKYKRNQIIKPHYQREDGVWSDKMCATLILSIIKGVPIPPIYLFQQRSSSTLELMDGLQRITALRKFYDGEIAVTIDNEKKFIKDDIFQNGGKYSNFINRELAVVRIEQRTPDGDESGKYEIFRLLNRNSMPLTDQEIRKSIYFGKFLMLFKDINENQDWRMIWGKKDIKKSRALDEEILLRAFILRFIKLDKYRNTTKAINGTLSYYQKLETNNLSELKDVITKAKSKFESVFSFMAQNKCFHGINNNKARLDSTLAALMYCDNLSDIKSIEGRWEQLNNDSDYKKYIREGTGDAKKVIERLRIAKQYLIENQ
jgi:hypothetical protein